MADVKKLRETLAEVVKASEMGLWVQDEWISPVDIDGNEVDYDCGTAGCFAGWRCFMDGCKPVVVDGQLAAVSEVIDTHGRLVSVRAHAQQSLGLTDYDAADLFDSGNDIEQLEWVIDRIEESQCGDATG